WTLSPMAVLSFSLRAGIRRVGAMLRSAREAVQRHFPIDLIGPADEVRDVPRGSRAPRYSTRHDMVTRARRRPRPEPGRQAVLAAASLGSGAALVTAIATRTTLALTLPAFALLGLTTTALWCVRVPANVRLAAGREAFAGALARLVATLAHH